MIFKALLPLLLAGVTGLQAAEKWPRDATGGSGVNIHFTDAKPGELEMIQAAGFKHLRMDFTWDSTEKQRGVYDFSAYDRLTESLEKRGMKGYYILDYANPLYEKDRSVRTAEGRAAFAKWAAAAVTHFKGRGICWEIWNEPNGGFWKPLADVNEYVALAVEASKAIRAADPEAILTGPATSTIDMVFLEGCFKAGLLEWWDAVSVHPYRQEGPESVEFEYDALRRLIARYAPAGKSVPILSGEWGYSAAWMHHDRDSQGRMLARQWLMNAANSVPISIWYDWHDDGPDPKEAEHHFGTVALKYHEGRDPVYDAKPAYLAAKTYNTVLKDFRFVKRLSLGNMDHQAVLFEREGALVLAAWTSLAGQHPVHLPSEDSVFQVTGHLGQTLPEVTAKEGRLSFTLSDSPVYFRFEGTNRKLSSAPEALRVRVSIVPCSGAEVVVKVENLTGRAQRVKVSLDRISGLEVEELSREVELPATESVTDVLFPLKQAPKGDYEAGATMETGGAVVLEIAPRRFSPPDPAVLKDAHVTGEGDPKVEGIFKLSAEEAPEKFPGGSGRVMRLDYDFAPGWKYAPVYPSAEGAAKQVEGRGGSTSSRALFGLWIYGDSSNLAPRLRVRDAAGRTWQPSAPEIKWRGWKYVELKLDQGTAHWGGEDQKAQRGPKFPLKWEAPFLLDNPLRVAVKGTIYFTMPVVILE